MKRNSLYEYGYETGQKFVGIKKQVTDAGFNPDYCHIFGKGFGDCEFPQPNKPKILTFTANEDDCGIAFVQYFKGEPAEYDMWYRINDGEWTEYDILQEPEKGEEPSYIILEHEGDYVEFKGVNPNGLNNPGDEDGHGVYCMTDGSLAASGDVTSIINGVGGDCQLTSCCFNYFFAGTNLTTAPALPSTTLAENCYQSMFSGCESLATAPELPATTLVEGCYSSMFENCTSLATAPELPATTLAEYCYQGMFNGCESLVTASELPATTLVEGCYSSMFDGCASLNSITCLATDISANVCTNNWVNGVSNEGTFTKCSSTKWSAGTSGIPDGWNVVEL